MEEKAKLFPRGGGVGKNHDGAVGSTGEEFFIHKIVQSLSFFVVLAGIEAVEPLAH